MYGAFCVKMLARAGGGPVRSLGGWTAVKALPGKEEHIKGDERILGDGDFVLQFLDGCRQELERRYRIAVKGYDFDWLVSSIEGGR